MVAGTFVYLKIPIKECLSGMMMASDLVISASASDPLRRLQYFNDCFGHNLLGYQIFLLTLVGLGCAAVAAAGLILVLDSNGWSRTRLLGIGLVPLFLALGATCWGWAVYGKPWTFWALLGLGSCV